MNGLLGSLVPSLHCGLGGCRWILSETAGGGAPTPPEGAGTAFAKVEDDEEEEGGEDAADPTEPEDGELGPLEPGPP